VPNNLFKTSITRVSETKNEDPDYLKMNEDP